MVTKQEIVKAVIHQFKSENGCIQPIDLDDLTLHNIFFSAKQSGGLRLSEWGFRVLSEFLQIEHWDFKIDIRTSPISRNRLLLYLDKHVTCPYYIVRDGFKEIKVFDAKLGTAIALTGDPIKFIINKEDIYG